jgi:diguanylate cyclase
MISIRKSISEIDLREQRFRVATQCYLAAIKSIEQNPVVVQRALTRQFRGSLEALLQGLGEDPPVDRLESSQRALAEALRGYRERADKVLAEREREVREIVQTLDEGAAALTAQNTDHHRRLGDSAKELESVTVASALPEIRRRLTQLVRELRACIAAIDQERQSAVEQMRSELVAFQQRLAEAESLAYRDALTGVANRAEGDKQLQERVEAGVPFSILVLDLNRFKAINDQWGHAAGDIVLTSFAHRLTQNVRPEDTVYRWGGDEFLVILRRCRLAHALDRGRALADRCGGDYEISLDGQNIITHVSVALGAAEYVPGETVKELFVRADKYMYREKQASVPD